MRKALPVTTTIATLATTVLVLQAQPALAAPPGGARPTFQITAFEPQTGGPEGTESQLIVDAVDPDGVIMEVQVLWGDGGVTWAGTYCLQGRDPGTPAHLIIPHTYTEPGRYRVRVEVSSLQACPFEGPGGVEQHSSPKTAGVVVTEVPEPAPW